MKINSVEKQSGKRFSILFLLHLSAVMLWIAAQLIDPTKYKLVGAIVELIWLPMLACILLTPIVSLYFWYKDKFKLKSKFLYLLLWSVSFIFILSTQQR